MRPGVPMMIWLPRFSSEMFSWIAAPPTRRAHFRFSTLHPMDTAKSKLWRASSFVGDRTMAWDSRESKSIRFMIPIMKAAVLPVPDCACATTFRPWIMGTIALRWIVLGLSKPATA